MRFSARLLFASLLALAGLSTHVDAHARLGSPAPWNARPSTAQACGLARGRAMVNPQISLVNSDAKVMNVQWYVVIGDGVGPLSASIDTTGKLNPTAADFKVALQSVGPNNPNRVSQTPYNVMFTIPQGITCTGPGATCTLRVRSTSNWVACATIQFQPGAASPAAPAAPGGGGVVTQPRPTTTRPATTRPPTTRPPTTQPPVVTNPPDDTDTDTTPEPTTPDDPDTTPETTTPPQTTTPPDNTDPDDTTPQTTTPPDNTDNDNPNDVTPETSEPTPYILDPNDLILAPEDISGLNGFILDPRSPIFRTSAALDNQCVTPTNLRTCSSVNGQSVQLLGPDALSVDAQAAEEIDFAMSNTTMLTRPNTVGCRQAFIDLMCAQMFPPCGAKGTVVCTSSCLRVNNLCKPNTTEIIDAGGQKTTHASMYECANRDLGFTAINSDSTGMCPAVATGIRPTRMNTATSVSSSSSSSTLVFGIVTSLLALIARV